MDKLTVKMREIQSGTVLAYQIYVKRIYQWYYHYKGANGQSNIAYYMIISK